MAFNYRQPSMEDLLMENKLYWNAVMKETYYEDDPQCKAFFNERMPSMEDILC